MSEYRDRSFAAGEVVDIDGNRYLNCQFAGAQLRYGGGAHPYFEDCDLMGSGWYFTDAALRTIQFLQVINDSPGGDTFIADLFKAGRFIAE